MKSLVLNPPALAPEQPIPVGEVIHGYRLRRELGSRPGIHVVVEASAPDGRLVALTLFAPGLTRNSVLRSRVLRLARLRASIEHPHLLPVLGVHENGDGVVLVSEVPGPWTLGDRLRLGPLPPRGALWLLSQVASGLDVAAARGLVHQDFAPGAIVMDDGEPANALLTDFGIALPPARACELLGTQGVLYRPPEAIRGEPSRQKGNVYSLTCILVECLTGSPPFPYDRPLLTMHAHAVETPPRISTRTKGLPRAIDDVVAKGMAKDSRMRFGSSSELIWRAAEALGMAAPATAAPSRRRPRRDEPPGRNRWTRGQQARSRRLVRRHEPPGRDGRARGQRARSRWRGRASVWVGLAFLLSAASGFAIANLDSSSPRSAPAAAPAAAAAEQRVAREERTEYVQAVGRAVERLDRRRAEMRRELWQAGHPEVQAEKARALASEFREARESLPSPLPPLSDVRLERTLREAERAYRSLAVAARGGDGEAWNAAREDALRHEEQLERGLATLRSSYDRLERRSVQRVVALIERSKNPQP